MQCRCSAPWRRECRECDSVSVSDLVDLLRSLAHLRAGQQSAANAKKMAKLYSKFVTVMIVVVVVMIIMKTMIVVGVWLGDGGVMVDDYNSNYCEGDCKSHLHLTWSFSFPPSFKAMYSKQASTETVPGRLIEPDR